MQLWEIAISIRLSSDECVMTLKASTGSSWADRLQKLVTEYMVDDLTFFVRTEWVETGIAS
jgi:hypothetical protein